MFTVVLEAFNACPKQLSGDRLEKLEVSRSTLKGAMHVVGTEIEVTNECDREPRKSDRQTRDAVESK